MAQARQTPSAIYGNRFAVEAISGHGGMGAIYRARDAVSGRPVALKVLFERSGEHVERFEQEALLLAELDHPAVVRYVDHGVTPDGERYLAMEWLEGETLEERLLRGALTLVESLTVARRSLEALAVAHRKGIVHRDIKPANLFLPEGHLGQLKVLDFGIARRAFDGRRITVQGSTLGTPMYMSPEQARGQADLDPRADLFSLGCVLFECLSGQPPFTGETPLAVLAKICLDDSVDIRQRCPGLPASVEGPLRAMLAKDRDARPADTGALADELGRVLEQMLALGHEAPDPTREPRARRITPTLTGTEDRVYSAIMVRPARAAADAELGAVVGWDLSSTDVKDRFRRLVEEFGGRVETLYDGTLVVAIAGVGAPSDQATQAARCALAIKDALPAASMAISTRRAEARGTLALGPVLEETGRMLIGERQGRIRLDAPTSKLLAARFELTEDEGRYLLFEKGLREPPRSVLGREVPCVGRDREIAMLDGLWDEVVGEPVARAVLVTAPAGGGKSRVRHEFLERVAKRGASLELLVGRGEPLRDGSAYAMLGSALRGAANVSGHEPAEVRRKRLAKHLTRRLPEEDHRRITSFLGELCGIRYPADGYAPLEAARQDPRIMADQVLTAWVDWLEAELEHQPVLLVLEDLHWGDVPSVRLVDAALRLHRERPLMVAAFARPEVDDRFAGLWEERDLQRVGLPPLTSKAALRLARAVIADMTEERAAWITERAEGNPFFLEELLRAEAEGQLVSDRPLPDTVLGMVQARLDQFGEEAKRVLRAASIYGHAFSGSGLLPLLGDEAEPDLGRWLGFFERKEILQSRSVGGTRELRFRQALVRDAAYEALTKADRRNGHRLAGEWLESTGAAVDPMVMVEHFERGGLPGKAAEWSAVGAERALEGDDLGAVIARAERGLGFGPTGELRGRLLAARAQGRRYRGSYAEALVDAEEAVALASGVVRLSALETLVKCVSGSGKAEELERAATWLARYEPLPAEVEAWQIALVATLRHGIPLGLSTDSVNLLRSRLDACVAELHPLCRAQLLDMEGYEATCSGAKQRAIELFSRAASELELIGDRRRACSARVNAAVSMAEAGEIDAAEANLLEANKVAERLGLLHVTEAIAANLLPLLRERGAVAEAIALATRCCQMATRRGDAVLAAYCLCMRAVCEGDTNPRQALSTAREAVDMLASNPMMLPLALAALARAHHILGEASEAMELSGKAFDLLRERGSVEDGESLICLVRAEVLVGRGALSEATSVLSFACARLAERARIQPDGGAKFLSLRDHAALFQLQASVNDKGRSA